MKIIKKFGSWAVTDLGVEHLGKPGYEIAKEAFWSNDWVAHMSQKRWVSLTDFGASFEFALSYHYGSKIAA
jgi:hypothetical protein